MNSQVAGGIIATLLLFGGASRASAQDCPSSSSGGAQTASRDHTLEGRLIYHDGIRQWFELKLDRAQCGESSVQVTTSDRGWTSLQTLRGCRVQTNGKISFSLTGYYSLGLYQDETMITPIGACSKKHPFADFSRAKPDRRVGAYRVDMDIDYRPGDHPIKFHIRNGYRNLHPWQAYASYMLTGGFVLYGSCGDGFVVDKVFGTQAARPTHSDDPRDPSDMATFDPETAAQTGMTHLQLGYTCVREGKGSAS